MKMNSHNTFKSINVPRNLVIQSKKLSRPNLYVKIELCRKKCENKSICSHDIDDIKINLKNSKRYSSLVCQESSPDIWKNEIFLDIISQYKVYRTALHENYSFFKKNSEKYSNSILKNNDNLLLNSKYDVIDSFNHSTLLNNVDSIDGFDVINSLEIIRFKNAIDFEKKKFFYHNFLDNKSIHNSANICYFDLNEYYNKNHSLEIFGYSFVQISPFVQPIKFLNDPLNIPLYPVLKDSDFHIPLNPTCIISQLSSGVKGRGVLKRFGVNLAADAIITRWNPISERLQVLLIQRTDGSEMFAFPGGFVDDGEQFFPVKSVIREFLEEAIDIKGIAERLILKYENLANDVVIDVEEHVIKMKNLIVNGESQKQEELTELFKFHQTLEAMKMIFGEFRVLAKSKKFLSSSRISKEKYNFLIEIKFDRVDKIKLGKIIYCGYLDDERNTDNSWIETFAMNYLIPYDLTEKFEVTAGDDARENSARFYDIVDDEYLMAKDVRPLKNLFASHSKILKRMLKEHYPNEFQRYYSKLSLKSD